MDAKPETKPKLKRSLNVSSCPADEKPKKKRRQPEYRAPIKPWTEEEIAALWARVYAIAKANVPAIAAAPELSHRTIPNVHNKLDSLLKMKYPKS